MLISGKSDIGLVREHNEDCIYYGENANHDQIAIVCDGIGGSNAGDIASSMGVSIIKSAFLKKPKYDTAKSNYEWLIDTVECANKSIYQEAQSNEKYNGMGTTLVGALIVDNYTYLFHLGDSRAYGLYQNKLELLTQDHNLAADLIKAGEINEKEASKHPRGALLTNALGIWNEAKVEINKINNNYKYLLLCSDGLHGYVNENNIKTILLCSEDDETKVNQLISQSKIAGGFDNVSVILIHGGDDSE